MLLKKSNILCKISKTFYPLILGLLPLQLLICHLKGGLQGHVRGKAISYYVPEVLILSKNIDIANLIYCLKLTRAAEVLFGKCRATCFHLICLLLVTSSLMMCSSSSRLCKRNVDFFYKKKVIITHLYVRVSSGSISPSSSLTLSTRVQRSLI